MSEIQWDLAPEGATMIISSDKELRWANEDGQWVFFSTKGWEFLTGNPLKLSCWKVIATRPRPQQKTVADAYGWAKGKWQEGKLAICELDGEFYFSDNNLRMRNVVCTRQQFEAYAKEREGKQEGEKWTHLTPIGDPCFIRLNEPDSEGLILIEIRNYGYELVSPEQLKPIKPTLTKAEAWDLVQDYEGVEGIAKYILELHEKHDII